MEIVVVGGCAAAPVPVLPTNPLTTYVVGLEVCFYAIILHLFQPPTMRSGE